MDSIFTKIIKGEIPGHFVWQDEQCVVITTIQPVRPGHVLVIPRQPVDHWDDLPGELAAHLIQVAQKIAKALKQCFPCTRVGMIIAGLEVPHTHLHLIPIDTMQDMNFSGVQFAQGDELAAVAGRIRAALE